MVPALHAAYYNNALSITLRPTPLNCTMPAALPDVANCPSAQFIVSPDWLHLACVDTAPPRNDTVAANSITGREDLFHDPAFHRFQPRLLSGFQRSAASTALVSHVGHAAPGGRVVDFLGVVYPWSLYCNKAYLSQCVAHAIRCRTCNMTSALSHAAMRCPSKKTQRSRLGVRHCRLHGRSSPRSTQSMLMSLTRSEEL